jgi:hypothetical protein
MLLKAFLCIGLTATAVSAAPAAASGSSSLVKRDLPAVTASFDNVSKALDKLIDAVTGFDGDLDKLPVLLETSESITKMNLEGAAKVKASPTMGIMDALNIINPTLGIQEKVNKVMGAFMEKKDLLEKAGVKDVVLDQMIAQRKAADELAGAITGNLPMPGLLGAIAKPIAKTITDALDVGIKNWGGTPPPPADGSKTAQRYNLASSN